MIGAIFQFANEVVEVRVSDNQVYFRDTKSGGYATIEQLNLNKVGVVKEHPDLKDDTSWRIKAIERFKDKIKSYNTELQKMEYIIQDLKKFGYKPMLMQQQGHRPIKLNKDEDGK